MKSLLVLTAALSLLLAGCHSRTVSSSTSHSGSIFQPAPNNVILVANNTGSAIEVLVDGEVAEKLVESGDVYRCEVFTSLHSDSISLTCRSHETHKTVSGVFQLQNFGRRVQTWSLTTFNQ